MSKRKSFLIHIDSLDILDDLTDEQAGQLFKAIKSHQKGQSYELTPIVKIAFSPFKNQFARDDEKYEKLCEKNRLIAEKRYATKSTTGKSGNETKPIVTKSTDNKSDNKSDSDNKRSVSRFTPPTQEEVFLFMQEKGYPYQNEAMKFVNFYGSKGWMVGKNKMKNWKLAVNNWLSNCNLPKQQAQPEYDHEEARQREIEALRRNV